MTHAIRLFHIRIDLDLHGSSSHISHISLKYYDLSLIDCMLELKIVHCRSYHPVSYTHLDVYKRQILLHGNIRIIFHKQRLLFVPECTLVLC